MRVDDTDREVEDRILYVLRENGPTAAGVLADKYLALSAIRNDVDRAIGRLRARRLIRCGITVPYAKWHLVDGCPCSVCRARARR